MIYLFLVGKGATSEAEKYIFGSSKNSLQAVELSGHSDLQIVVNLSL